MPWTSTTTSWGKELLRTTFICSSMEWLLVIAGTSDMLKMTRTSFFQKMKFSWDLGIRLCEMLIQHKDLREIINSKREQFDVIIISAFFNDCVLGISYMLDIPIIKMCSFGGTKWMDEWVVNRSPYAYLPQIFSDYGEQNELLEENT